MWLVGFSIDNEEGEESFDLQRLVTNVTSFEEACDAIREEYPDAHAFFSLTINRDNVLR